MDTDDIIKIREDIRKHQTKKRFEHTLGVAYTAAALSFIYNEEPIRALITGLLHDSAKCYSTDEQILFLTKAGTPPDEELLLAKKVIHAKAGAVLARERYGITDLDMLNAISYHTTARPHMSTLEKIIFVADYIEPTREEFKNLREIRKLAFSDIDECVYRVLADTIERLNDRGLYIYHDTINAFQWYAKERLL